MNGIFCKLTKARQMFISRETLDSDSTSDPKFGVIGLK
jgi:hypothetical protein